MAVTVLAKYSDVSGVASDVEAVDGKVRATFQTQDEFQSEALSSIQSEYGTTGALVATVRETGFSYQIDLAQADTFDLETPGGVEVSVLPGPDGFVNLRAFGLVSGGVLQDILETALTSENPNCILDVDCIVTASKTNIQMTKSGSLKGVGTPTISFDGGHVIVVENTKIASTTLSSDVDFKGKTFPVADASEILEGDLLEVRSSQEGLDGTSAIKKAMYVVASVSGSTVTTSEQSPWDYITASGTIDVYTRRPNTFRVSDCHFTKTGSGDATYFRLTGWVKPTIEAINLDDGGEGGTNFGAVLFDCHSGVIQNCFARGMTYPYNHNYSRNISVKNVSLVGGRHAIDCVGSIDCLWDGVYGDGNDSTIGTHTHIGAVIRNVKCYNELGPMAVRGVDFVLENILHQYDDSISAPTSSDHQYALSTFTNEASARDLRQYRASFLNVKSIPNANGATLTIGTAWPYYDLIVRGCDIGLVLSEGTNPSSSLAGTLALEGSRLNRFRWRGGPVRIQGCVFPGTLTGDTLTYALGFSDTQSDTSEASDTTLFVVDTKVNGYANACHTDLRVSQHRRFSNCQFSNITGAIAQPNTDGQGAYYFNSCNLINVASFSTNSTPADGMNFNFCQASGTTPSIP